MSNLERSVTTLNARNHLNPSRPDGGQPQPGDVVESILFLAWAARMIGAILPVGGSVMVNRWDLLEHQDFVARRSAGMGFEPRPSVFRSCGDIIRFNAYDFQRSEPRRIHALI